MPKVRDYNEDDDLLEDDEYQRNKRTKMNRNQGLEGKSKNGHTSRDKRNKKLTHRILPEKEEDFE